MSGDRDAKERAEERIKTTGGLFHSTEPQPQERPPIEEQADQEAGKARKPRTWDKANPAFSFRILPEDNDRVAEAAARLGMTRDEIARGLMGAALDALEEGRLTLDAERRITVKKITYTTRDGKQVTRRHKTTESDITWKWRD